MNEKMEGSLHSLPLVPLTATRMEVLAYFRNTWALTELLFSGLSNEEAYYRRPTHRLRHPLIFYYAHPAILYVNKLRVAGLLDGPVNESYERLFEVGVDEMRWDDLREGADEIWPAVADVTAYRARVYSLIEDLIRTHPDLDRAVTHDSPMWALFMSFEHERIHLETSSVLMRELPVELVRKPRAWPAYNATDGAAPSNTMIAREATRVTLGKPRAFPSFGWDNEYGSEVHEVAAFSASQFLVSNGEFKGFVASGGYTREELWSEEGWAWRRFRNVKWPTFWVPQGPQGLHDYALRTIFEIIPMPENWPVCVNFHEAKAFCAWKSAQDGRAYRLLSEVEQHAIRSSLIEDAQAGKERDPVMSGAFRALGYNMNFSSGSESPVDAGVPNDKGFYDTFGNVWRWSEDFFRPLHGTAPHPYYEDFSVPCYDNEHHLILGGSFMSTGDQASIFARYHFRPHFFQHAGFRLALSAEAAIERPTAGAALYESQEMLNKYMLLHWGSDAEILHDVPQVTRPETVHLPKKCASLVTRYATHFDSALDLGCAVGRASFELARRFTRVVGVDYSREFVERARELQRRGESAYWRKATGVDGTELVAKVDDDIDLARVAFEEGDACALSPQLAGFSAVLMANVLCRLPDPAACLRRMQGEHALVARGGILVMTTPLSWLEDYTPKAKWLHGLSDIAAILTEFERVHEEELPFMIREHQRKFEYIVTQASVWRRK